MGRWQCLAIVLSIATSATAGPYEDCILQNMKGVQAHNAASAIARACREKTTPKRCRAAALKERIVDLDANKNSGMSAARGAGYSDEELEAFWKDVCFKECADASYWSRTFGECKTD